MTNYGNDIYVKEADAQAFDKAHTRERVPPFNDNGILWASAARPYINGIDLC